MPPRRTRGVRKSYAEIVGPDSDNESGFVPDNESEDGDFDEQAASQRGHSNQGEDDDDGDDDVLPSSEDDSDDGDKPGMDDSLTSGPKKIRNAGAGIPQSRRNFHEIPHYPLETRIVTRVYAGPLRRYARYSALRDCMYGPEYHRVKIIWDLEKRWQAFSVLPPGFPPSHPQGVAPSPWVPLEFEDTQETRAMKWLAEFQANKPDNQRIRLIPNKHGQRLVPQTNDDILFLSGPFDRQRQYRISPGTGISLSFSGVWIDEPEIQDQKLPGGGWAFDVGGIPLAIGWAPSNKKNVQILAVASVPFSDQDMPLPKDKNSKGKEENPDPSAGVGAIQFWEFAADCDGEGLASASRSPPVHVLTRCFDWGRPKRLQWCPVPFESEDRYGMLAVLCGDGIARVFDVKKPADQTTKPVYEWMESPLAEMSITADYSVNVTCLAWVNLNRLVLGHKDGSITLWSVYPCKLLQRVAAHTTHVIDICTGYPSNPYIVATVPVGGCVTITDLSQPSSEFTYFPVPAINFQPNLICWSEPMQGFMALYPSSTPNTTVAFLHHRFFCQARSICTGPNAVTCITTGSTHPFLLTGGADGSVYSCNGLQKLFKQKAEPLNKIKVMEHEYKPSSDWNNRDMLGNDNEDTPSLRGASRILQGFLPEINDDPRTERRKELDRKKKIERHKKAKTKKGRKRAAELAAGGADMDELDDRLNSLIATHEPLTRVTSIAWNPNLMFSCWAACAMGSGLVRVVDLGAR
ncbi:WD40-repeat-containing domain protein [Naviculisporaceae sp. PSN 640]